jgi:hypothetical protein
MVFGIGGILRIAGLMERSLDNEISRFVGRRCATNAVVALDQQRAFLPAWASFAAAVNPPRPTPITITS